MKAGLPLGKLPEVWDSILAQTGPFKGIQSVKVMEKQGLHAAFVTCEFERTSLDAKIFMDDQGTVKGLFFEPASSRGQSGLPLPPNGRRPAYVNTNLFHDRDTTII